MRGALLPYESLSIGVQAATLCVQAATLCAQVLDEETEELLPPLLAAAPLERAARHAAQRARLVLALALAPALALALTLALTLSLTLTLPTLALTLTLALALAPTLTLTPGDASGLVAQDAGGDCGDGTPHRAAPAHHRQPGADGAHRKPHAQGVCVMCVWYVRGTCTCNGSCNSTCNGTCTCTAHAWCIYMAHGWHMHGTCTAHAHYTHCAPSGARLRGRAARESPFRLLRGTRSAAHGTRSRPAYSNLILART